MRFLDEAVITTVSGNGGRGCVSFRREKFIPKGGPDGGDGGKGGDVIIRASKRLQTLADFSSKRHFKSQNGSPGRGKNQTGRDGADTIIEVPLGTLLYDEDTGGLLADLVEEGQDVPIVPGGIGGKGNSHFATSTNRAPRFAQPGIPGQKKRIRLSLKYIADIGIIGLPNAGKSTLLSRLTMAHPKIDSYPFTTLFPNLGVIEYDDRQTLTVADIPGLIEGASEGRGLGHHFLKHIERTRFLLHLIDITRARAGHLLEDFHVLQDELAKYSPSLDQKEQMVVINKIDLLPDGHPAVGEMISALAGVRMESHAISALAGDGIEELKQILARKMLKK